MSRICGRSVEWVHLHALTLGGFKVSDNWFFTIRKLKQALYEYGRNKYVQKPKIESIKVIKKPCTRIKILESKEPERALVDVYQ